MNATLKENRPSEVIYQVYPSSYYDADGDGQGDLKGITAKLDYIKSLGVDAVWISPFFLSPTGAAGDGGYAVTDYKKIDPRYGTMEDFDQLLEEAHKRGLRIYTDFVMCHTSNEHDWFEKSRNREAGYENRYVWHDGVMKGDKRCPPNNWKSCFTNKTAWEWDEKRKQYFLHHFNTSQPALNLNDEKVQDAVLAEMKFWLDKGVDGLRLDALPFANHDPQFRDNRWRGDYWPNDESKERWDMQKFDRSMCQSDDDMEHRTQKLVAKIRKLLDSYPTKKSAIGEVIAGREGGTQSPEEASKYIDPKTGLDTCYTESLIRFWEYPKASDLRNMMRESLKYSPDGAFCNNASNHDFPRAASRMAEKAPQELHSSIVRQLMSMYVSLPGSLCLYQGEELGLPQARIPEDIPHHKKKDLVDPRCRDGARTPMPWDSSKKNAGFTESDDPYLPIAAAHYSRAVDRQENEPNSMLQFTRQLINERKENPALSKGVTTLLETDQKDPDIFAFIRKAEGQTILMAYNMSGRAKTFHPADYLDAETLKELKIPAWSDIRIHAYSYSRHGINSPSRDFYIEGMRDDVPPVHEKGKAKKIFAADMLIADHLLPDEKAARLISSYKLEPDHKAIIERETHDKLIAESATPALTFGGSTAITMWTLKKLLKDDVNVDFMGLAANDKYGELVKKMMQEADINLLTKEWPEGEKQENAVSHVIKHPSGHNTVLTYPGTQVEALKKLLAKPENAKLLEDNIRKCDVVYLPGAMIEKFGQTFTDELLKLRWRHKKELVLALPTHASFGPNDNQTFKRLIPSANVVMGNDVEFCRLYDMPTKRPVSDQQLQAVTNNIQAAFRSNVLAQNEREGPMKQVAFITRGDKPSLLITADDVLEIDAAKVQQVENILGAGDASFAGFLAGYVKGLEHKQSAELSMALSGEKIMQANPNPHLDDPEKSLQKAFMRKSLSQLADVYRGTPGSTPLKAATR
jgi:alpha-glucosidase